MKMKILISGLIALAGVALLSGCDNNSKPKPNPGTVETDTVNKNMYKVTYNLDGGVNNPDNLSEYSPSGSGFMLKDPSKEKYKFDGWYTSSSFEESSQIYKIANDTGNITVYAKWIRTEYKITFDSNGGSKVFPLRAIYGRSLGMLPIPILENADFNGWFYKDENGVEKQLIKDQVYLFNHDIVVKAKWSMQTKDFEYTILDNNTIRLDRYIGSKSKIEIPNEISGKKVCVLSKNLFTNAYNVEEIIIPASVHTLYAEAFYNNGLKKITISKDNLIYKSDELGNYIIEKGTNKLVLSLKLREIPEGVEIVGKDAFAPLAKSMHYMYIPRSVKKIEEGNLVDGDRISFIYYAGTEEEFKLIEISDKFNVLSRVRYKYNCINKDFLISDEITLEVNSLDASGNVIEDANGPKKELKNFDVVLDAKFPNTVSLVIKCGDEQHAYFGGYETTSAGYRFMFTNDVIINSRYNPDTYTNELALSVKLDDRGLVNFNLSMHEPEFFGSEALFLNDNLFAGALIDNNNKFVTDNGLQAGIGFKLKLFKNNMYEFSNNHIKALSYSGKFNYLDGVYILELPNGEKVQSKLENGIYTFNIPVEINSKKYDVKMTYNYNFAGGYGLSGESNDGMVNGKVNLELYNDGTFFADYNTKNPLMSAIGGIDAINKFDIKGSYIFDEESNEYVLSYTATDNLGNPIEKTARIKYNESIREYELNLYITGKNITLTGRNLGKFFKLKK